MIAIFFYLTNDGALHIIITIGDPLLQICKGFAFVFDDIIEIALFQSGLLKMKECLSISYRP